MEKAGDLGLYAFYTKSYIGLHQRRFLTIGKLAQALDQNFQIEGLHYVIVGPQFHGLQSHLLMPQGGQDQDFGSGIQGTILKAFQYPEAVQVGHNYIQDHYIWKPLLDKLQGFMAVMGHTRQYQILLLS